MEENNKNLGEIKENDLEEMTGDIAGAGISALSAVSVLTAITPRVSYALCPTGTGCTNSYCQK